MLEIQVCTEFVPDEMRSNLWQGIVALPVYSLADEPFAREGI
jgi:hypothetical protein